MGCSGVAPQQVRASSGSGFVRLGPWFAPVNSRRRQIARVPAGPDFATNGCTMDDTNSLNRRASVGEGRPSTIEETAPRRLEASSASPRDEARSSPLEESGATSVEVARSSPLEDARASSLHLAELLRRENTCKADFLLALLRFEDAGGHRRLGFASLFDYLHRELLLPRSSAHQRRVAVRLIRRFPAIIKPFRDGRLCLSTVVELDGVLDEETWQQVLPRFFHLSRQEAKEVAAEIRPAKQVPLRTIVTSGRPAGTQTTLSSPDEHELTHPERVGPSSGAAVDPRTGAPMGAQATSAPTTGDRPADGSSSTPHIALATQPRVWVPASTSIQPMTAGASRLHLTVPREFLVLLRQARAGQARVQPGATDADILLEGLKLLLDQQAKRKASVPARVKREVMQRDGGRCQWKLADGSLCGATVHLEIDHVQPRARGGPSTTDNCRVLCRAHNIEAARQFYGHDLMDRFAPREPVVREPVVREPTNVGAATRAPASPS